MFYKSIPFSSRSFLLRSVLFVVYTPAEVIIFLSADKPRNRLGASLGQNELERSKNFTISNESFPHPYTTLLEYQPQDANQNCFGGERGWWKSKNEKN